jgi:two-component system, NarL family, sensor histidine kinase DevS
METLGEDRLRRLIAVGRSLVSELDLEVVLQRLLEVARELTGARYAALGILDDRKEALERFITVGVDEDTRREIGDLPRGRGVLGVLIRDPQPLRLEDVGAHPESYGFPPGHPPMTTFLGVPVLIRGEAYGNLYLTEKDGDAAFTAEDEHAVVVLADWAAIAIENARLYQSAERRRRELERAVRGLEVTTAIARAVGGETDLDRVLELIVKRARALVEARSLCILLQEADELVVAATAGEIDRTLGGERLPAAGSVASEVIASGRPERIADVAARGLTLTPHLGLEATSALIVPLAFRSQYLGVLMAFDRLEDGPEFKRDDEELMLSFAASAATAVHTARSVADERLAHALEGAEQERRRWARELHDETLQGLGGLQLLLSAGRKEDDPEKLKAVVGDVGERIREEIASLRNLIVELRPAELDELGLEPALEALAARRAESNGLRVRIDVDLGTDAEGSARRLAPPVESTIYRIVQEALSNAAKHSGADRIDVRVEAANGTVELVVSDDGAGFDLSKPTSGFGLLGMRERVAMLRGDFEIESAPDKGTTVRARFPANASPGGVSG